MDHVLASGLKGTHENQAKISVWQPWFWYFVVYQVLDKLQLDFIKKSVECY